MHWIIFLKMRNSLIYPRKLTWGHKITRELNEYKKHIWTIVFLMLKLIPISVLLGICRKCKMCSIVSFLETRGMDFSYHILWLRKWRALEFKQLVPNCPNGVFLPAQRLPPSWGVLRLPFTPTLGLQGASHVLAGRTALRESGDAAPWGHMGSASEGLEQRTVSRNSEGSMERQCSIHLPLGLLLTHLQQLKSVGTCVAT